MPEPSDLLIVGAGPAGLAAAIAASRRGLSYVVLEKGALVNSLLHYPTDMVFFTTPELLEIGGFPFVSPYEKPTRQEALRYYRRVTDSARIDVRFDEPVTTITRRPDGFVVTSHPVHGAPATRTARAVVIATGAYDLPNRLGVPGEDLPNVSHYYREPHAFYRRRVVIVGGKNSAAEAALDIFRNGGQVLMVHRREALGESIKYWVKPDIENRIKEGSIRALFSTHVVEITPEHVFVDGPGGRLREPADAVLLLTGYRSDTTLLRQAGAAIDESIGAPVHHPDTYETTVPGLFVIGACIAGQQSGRIFIENGRFHGEVVVREIASRLQGQTART
ncbi:MAG TPA: YpdA family putative bacillithiol disulfide reductase [Vicinamibacterales bacterium]|nr:YpdA family putative bacillithiol disulfide reductase [Vicinamibacterales bacterium]